MRNFLLILFLILNFMRGGLAETVYHKVKKGETLNFIAKKYNVKIEQIVKLNNIVNPNSILAGQKLIIRSDDKDLKNKSKQPTNKKKIKPGENLGVDIIASSGKNVRSVANGKVVFSGLIKNYGGCIIIKYNTNWYISYSYVKAICVSSGEKVKAGQVIAQTGWLPHRRKYGARLEVRRKTVVKDPNKVFLNLKSVIQP
jgi:murein DD-endopeptidase MepM/ murein hydrolase activator NlpD